MNTSPDQLEPLPLAVQPVGVRPSLVALGVLLGLIVGYSVLISLATMLLRGPGIMPAGNELNPHRASFTATNALTCTGFQISTGHPQSVSVKGKVILLGLTVLGTCIPLILGGMAIRRILRFPWGDGRIVATVVGIEVVVLLLGMMAPVQRLAGDTMPADAAAQSVAQRESETLRELKVMGMLQTAAAWGNSGMHVGSPPRPGNPFTHLVLLPLAVLGGLGITVLLEMFDALFRKRAMSRHAKTVLALAAAFYFAGFFIILGLQVAPLWPQDELKFLEKLNLFFKTLAQANWPEFLGRASMLSINSRTAGMEILDMSAFSRVTAFFIILLMFVGAAPGGTGSGLKFTTLAALWRGTVRLLRGQTPSRSLGYALAWTGIFVAILLFGHLRLLATSAQSDDRVLFLITSALSNVGLSHDRVVVTGATNTVMVVTMVLGRIAPLAMLWWIAAGKEEVDIIVG